MRDPSGRFVSVRYNGQIKCILFSNIHTILIYKNNFVEPFQSIFIRRIARIIGSNSKWNRIKEKTNVLNALIFSKRGVSDNFKVN